eukprot:TRINITY_DN2277_c0_g1_i2.p1 TRINITY_DN2277_c0_g1~~TRINITY_DN2277_c0_g1_i2.p1  ORF type:complete len:213 (+),score=53.64 TRINITY_DN2277_c0_g1_i2:388-1026(+)
MTVGVSLLTGQSSAALNPEAKKKEPVTVISKLGIYQNPTGWHQGRRVWGGGIVKVKQEDWIPWKIDLDDSVSTYIGESFMGEVPTFHQNQTIQTSESLRGLTTAKAWAPNLMSIEVQELTPGEGNVHSGAIPPWMKQDDDKTNADLEALLEKFRKQERERKKKKNPNRVGADFVMKQLYKHKASEDWLPNFGGVWQPGPRSLTKKEFQERKR